MNDRILCSRLLCSWSTAATSESLIHSQSSMRNRAFRKEFDYGTAPILQDGRDIPQAKKGRIYFGVGRT